MDMSGNFVAAEEVAPATPVIGRVMDVSGGGVRLTLDARALRLMSADADPVVAAAGQVGEHVRIAAGPLWLVAVIRSLKMEGAESDLILAEADLLGEADARFGPMGGFRRGVTRYPMPGAKVHPATAADLSSLFTADDRPHVAIGMVHPTSTVRGALYIDALLGRHFALLGSTGTGKSTALALILHRICAAAPAGHIVMIDPHGEYAAAFASEGAVFDVDNLALPYWLMNFEEHAEILVTTGGAERQRDCDILARCLLAARAKNRAAEGIAKLTVDTPIPYLLSDLAALLQADMGKLDRAGDTSPYQRLLGRIAELRGDPRYAFMFSGMLVGDTMTSFLTRILRLGEEGRPISIIDTSGVPSEIVSVVVAVLARLVFDFALWSRGDVQRPVLLVCEEAHRYVPAADVPGSASVRRILERIAKEGRKYGVALGLVTQRPSDLAEGVLSQCGTIIAMRLNNERDQAHVRAAMPEGARGFMDILPALRNRECVISGEGVAIPVRIALDTLEPERRPASQDPVFSDLWRQPDGDAAMLERTIRRWRGQAK
jgi:DNA helicase HerA-like ATPase